MHATSLTSSLLAFASTALAVSSQAVLNNCGESVWLTVTNSTQQTTGPFEVKSTGAWEGPIVGAANSLGVTKNDQFWSADTSKLILGTTTSSGTLYWSVNDVNGNPVASPEKFLVSSAGSVENVCGNASDVGQHVSGVFAVRQCRVSPG
jgi:hypothetical protein